MTTGSDERLVGPGAAADVGAQIESLLAEISRAGGARAGAGAEELVRVLVDLYGDGLTRIVDAVVEAEPELLTELARDPLVEGLLILHGLHPVDRDTRIERALDSVRPYLGSHAGGVAYLGTDAEGVARLRLDGTCHGCPASTITVRSTIAEAVLAAAPELVDIEVDGVADRPAPLLQVGRGPGLDPVPEPTAWAHLAPRDIPADGSLAGVAVEGRDLLIARVQGTPYAYLDRCSACAIPLAAGSTLTGDVLACGGCGARFDIRLAGRAADGSGRHLAPVPLLDDVAGIRVALPEVGTPG